MGLLKTHDPKLDGFNWREFLHGLFRLWPAWIANLILLGIIYKVAPQQMGLLVYKTCFITWAALIGYWIYRWVEYEHDGDIERRRDRRLAYVCFAILGFALAA